MISGLNINSENNQQFVEFLIDKYNIDVASVHKQYTMNKRQEILKKHKDKYWYYEKRDCWMFNQPDPTKKEGRRKVTRKKKEDIEQLVVEYYLNHPEESMIASDRTIEKLFLEFMEYKKLRVNGNTVKRMMADWKKYYQPHTELIQKPVNQLTKIDIDNFFLSVVSTYKTTEQKDMTRKCFNNVNCILKQMLEYAVDRDYIEKNPFRVNIGNNKLQSYQKKQDNLEVFQADEKERLIEDMEQRFKRNPKNTAPLAIELEFQLGLRIGEMVALRESDIEYDNNCGNPRIHIQRQLNEKQNIDDLSNVTRDSYCTNDNTKTPAGNRYIPLSRTALKLIDRIKQANKDNNVSYGDYLFVVKDHIMYPKSIHDVMHYGCASIGTPYKSFHKIRKTYASELHEKGIPDITLMKIMGHTDIETTRKYYIRNIYDDAESYNAIINALT